MPKNYYLEKMKNFPTLILLLVLATACNPRQPESTSLSPAPTSYSFLVGTYTDSAHQGIQELYFSPSENKFEVEIIASEIQNPSFVLTNAEGNLVFSLEEDQSKTGGNILVFERSNRLEKLIPLDTIPSYGDHPCYLGLSPDEKLLAVANYTGGSLSLFEVSPSHQLKFIQTIQHFGKSVNPARQENPHVHSTLFSPDGKYLLAADLGTDKIYVYQIDRSLENPLSLFAEYPMTPGDGPRHLVFSSGGSRILVVQEMAAVLEVFEFQDGKMNSIARHSLVSDAFSGKVGAAEIRVFEDGKFAYASNRGDANAVVVFEKRGNGYVKIQEIYSGGIMPRNFNLTRDGLFLIVANQASNDLVVFARNLETGLLTPTQWKLSIHKPSYLFQLPD